MRKLKTAYETYGAPFKKKQCKIMEITKGEEREKLKVYFLKKMAGNFPNLGKEMNIWFIRP